MPCDSVSDMPGGGGCNGYGGGFGGYGMGNPGSYGGQQSVGARGHKDGYHGTNPSGHDDRSDNKPSGSRGYMGPAEDFRDSAEDFRTLEEVYGSSGPKLEQNKNKDEEKDEEKDASGQEKDAGPLRNAACGLERFANRFTCNLNHSIEYQNCLGGSGLVVTRDCIETAETRSEICRERSEDIYKDCLNGGN